MSKQRPLAGYCNTIRRIAYFTQALAPAFRSIKWQVAEHLEYDSTLEQRWAQFLKDYEAVVDDSRTAATKLSAIMNMYTSLLSAFQGAESADVVHELVTFKKSVSGAVPNDFEVRLEALKRAVSQFLSSLSPHAGRAELKGWLGSTSAAIQAVVYHLLWTPLLHVGGMLAPRPANGFNQVGEPNRGQVEEGNTFNEDPDSAQDVITNIKNTLVSLEAQKPLFGVFQQIADELAAEFERYSAALEAVKDVPKSPSYTEAVGKVHANAASRGEEWKELARVLTNEYARA
ncbi:uncharacterized protein TRAVEDRAFT_50802 [Trametes versicolor FP-101664 SS1]|uniref:uncharacterized protein n=1 Tax=Trametes versicolor (strain FP-101664) TaxID=717944 RepID=UPI000462370E|nr:uncharacterized protein TRAVEDRAFT_50802 [Trametes versicolor FP-101664 SS1]EIW54663.1 hypothetical protein TRAVEDRAFT_50802 [Trametes versicolor FP-101664 SS1]